MNVFHSVMYIGTYILRVTVTGLLSKCTAHSIIANAVASKWLIHILVLFTSLVLHACIDISLLLLDQNISANYT